MKKVYLAGPIAGCSDAECNDWRDLVISLLDSSFKAINPMRRDDRGKEDENINNIVELDKVDIVQSDAIIVSYDKPSVGTSMEVFFAFSLS